MPKRFGLFLVHGNMMKLISHHEYTCQTPDKPLKKKIVTTHPPTEKFCFMCIWSKVSVVGRAARANGLALPQVSEKARIYAPEGTARPTQVKERI